MEKERAVFSVSPEAVDTYERQMRDFGNFLLVRNTWELLEQQQPELMSYVHEVASGEDVDGHAYAAGVVSTYRLVHNQLEIGGEVPEITRSDIGLHTHNLNDQQVLDEPEEESDIDPDEFFAYLAQPGLNKFVSELYQTSPEFAEIVTNHLVNECFTSVEETSFIRGVYDVFKLFYRQREAEALYDELVWLPGLITAFDSGYYKYHNQLDEPEEPSV